MDMTITEEMTMTTTHDTLCATLRTLDTTSLTTQALAELCLTAVPEATLEDIAAALGAVADEQLREAEQLRLYVRCRRAGIRGVVSGDDDPTPPRAA